jgi:hypothetical protein
VLGGQPYDSPLQSNAAISTKRREGKGRTGGREEEEAKHQSTKKLGLIT